MKDVWPKQAYNKRQRAQAEQNENRVERTFGVLEPLGTTTREGEKLKAR